MLFKNQKAFTLIELLVAIAIVGVLAGILFVAINPMEQIEKARDAQSLVDIKNIESRLKYYYLENGQFPTASGGTCSGWRTGNQTYNPFIPELGSSVPIDPTYEACVGGYFYYKYTPDWTGNGCPSEGGDYYVLGIKNLETVNGGDSHPSSPGFSCSGRNWTDEFEWVTGVFENNWKGL